MTSKIVVNNIEADAGISTVTFQSEIQRGTSNLHSTGIEIANINTLGGSASFGGQVGVNTTSGNEKLNVNGAIRASGSSANFNAGPQGALVDYDLVGNAARFGHVNGASGSTKPVVFVTGGTERLRITGAGNLLPATNNSYDLGSTAIRWRNIFTNDLNLSNKGSTNSVDNTWGDYTIEEGENDLFLINNRSGKKFKFNLTEVS